MMGLLYDVETNTVNYHLEKVFADNELQEDSVLRNFRITAADGKIYDTQHYNLSRHHRGRLQGELGARRAVPQVGHRHHRVGELLFQSVHQGKPWL